MAPSHELEKLAIKQEGRMTDELTDGTLREYPFGLVRIEFMGETTAGRVVFAAPGTEPLLGMTALESESQSIRQIERLSGFPLFR